MSPRTTTEPLPSAVAVPAASFSPEKKVGLSFEDTAYSDNYNPEEEDDGVEEEEDEGDDEPDSSLERDWNAEFQSLLKMEDSFQKWDQLSALSKDFVYAAKVRMNRRFFCAACACYLCV